MKIPMRVDYGVRALVELALHYGDGPVQTAEIAAKQGIPVAYLDQLMASLNKFGFVVSRRGPRGRTLPRHAPRRHQPQHGDVQARRQQLPLDCLVNPLDCVLSGLLRPAGSLEVRGRRHQRSVEQHHACRPRGTPAQPGRHCFLTTRSQRPRPFLMTPLLSASSIFCLHYYYDIRRKFIMTATQPGQAAAI